MKTDFIAEVAIDDGGRLLIRPASHTYPMIYREAAEVHWEPVGGFFHSPKPREWSYLQWFMHIVGIAGDLVLSVRTEWRNVPDDLRKEIETWMVPRR